MPEQTPVELAILQVVNDLMFVGRPGTANLRRDRTTILAHNKDHPEAQTDLLDIIDQVAAGWGQNEVRTYDQLHELQIAAEFTCLHPDLYTKLGWPVNVRPLSRLKGPLRGLCVDGLLNEEECTHYRENAYVRPDGMHVYLNFEPVGRMWGTAVHSPDSLREFAESEHVFGHQSFVSIDRDHTAYVITTAGRAAASGVPLVLTPGVVQQDSSVGLVLDCEHSDAIVDGKTIPLKMAEVAILKAMIKGGDKGITKDALEKVHGGARRTLKSMLDTNPSLKKYVHMARTTGSGYRAIGRLAG